MVMGYNSSTPYDSNHPQFPQPSRPICSYNLNPVNRLPENIEALQLPQSSRPVCNYVTGSEPRAPENKPPTLYTTRPVGSIIASRSSSSEDMVSPFLAKTPREEVEAVEELVMILIECLDELNTKSRELLLRKFFSEIEKEISLERFIIARLRNSRVGAISELLQKLPVDNLGSLEVNDIVQRDINDVIADSMCTRSVHGSVEELSHKLERFKVKTPVNLGGVVKDEEQK